MNKHDFYTVDDFKDKAMYQEDRNTTQYYVVECGFQICKKCGLAEGDLREFCNGTKGVKP